MKPFWGYHVTSRGDRRDAIYEDDADRMKFLETLETVIRDFNWVCHTYCFMINHYHLMIETPDGNLPKGMRQLNGVYTQVTAGSWSGWRPGVRGYRKPSAFPEHRSMLQRLRLLS